LESKQDKAGWRERRFFLLKREKATLQWRCLIDIFLMR
jgi:hypothetical protein